MVLLGWYLVEHPGYEQRNTGRVVCEVAETHSMSGAIILKSKINYGTRLDHIWGLYREYIEITNGIHGFDLLAEI